MSRTIHWAKRIIAILLLPFCFGGVMALGRFVALTGEASTFWIAALGGAACWTVIFLLLPRPMWVYVLGHELTHVLWAWLFGGRVKRFAASAKGGRVVITRSNFLVSLAPYFFPFYVALVMVIFLAGNWIWHWTPFRAWFHFALGAAYAFHVTLTWEALRVPQSDIIQEGCLFSAVIIALGNLAVLMIGLPLLTDQPGPRFALEGWWLESRRVIFWLIDLLASIHLA